MFFSCANNSGCVLENPQTTASEVSWKDKRRASHDFFLLQLSSTPNSHPQFRVIMAVLNFTSAGNLPAILVEAIGPTVGLFAGWREIFILTLRAMQLHQGV